MSHWIWGQRKDIILVSSIDNHSCYMNSIHNGVVSKCPTGCGATVGQRNDFTMTSYA